MFKNILINLLDWPFRGRQKKLFLSRPDYTYNKYIEYFVERKINSEIAKEVWSVFKEEVSFSEYILHPDDEIANVFGIVDDDLDEIVLNILKKYNCKIPSSSETLKIKPVKTISSLVEFIVSKLPEN